MGAAFAEFASPPSATAPNVAKSDRSSSICVQVRIRRAGPLVFWRSEDLPLRDEAVGTQQETRKLGSNLPQNLAKLCPNSPPLNDQFLLRKQSITIIANCCLFMVDSGALTGNFPRPFGNNSLTAISYGPLEPAIRWFTRLLSARIYLRQGKTRLLGTDLGTIRS